MTFNSKAAHNDIYDMFNQPSRKTERDDTQSGDETDYGDDTYSDAESTGTGRISVATSEFGDETLARVAGGHALVEDLTQGSQPTSVSPWSDFTASKHVPKVESKNSRQHNHTSSEDFTDQLDSTQEQTQTSGVGGSFDTQAIAAIANGNFDDMKTLDIARLAGDLVEDDHDDTQSQVDNSTDDHKSDTDALKTPIEPDSPQLLEVSHATRYVPTAPEDYEPTPVRPYRDPAEIAQNKLPFMTPIAEVTESSLGGTGYIKNNYSARIKQSSGDDSPSKLKIGPLLLESPKKDDDTPRESPSKRRIREALEEEEILTGSPRKSKTSHNSGLKNPFELSEKELSVKADMVPAKPKAAAPEPKIPDAPIITNEKVLPMASDVRGQILGALITPLTAYAGYNESTAGRGQHDDVKKFVAKAGKSPKKGSNNTQNVSSFLLRFEGTSRIYAVKRELGAGAFATAFLVESIENTISATTPAGTPAASPSRKSVLAMSRSVSPVEDETGRANFEALKMEFPPQTIAWEFHIIRMARSRLSASADANQVRAVQSLVRAQECHVFPDEAYLVLSYTPQGTLLDLINVFRDERYKLGQRTDGVGLDEALVMFFGVEVIRTMQSLHSVGIMHGDIKSDNCLVRFDPSTTIVDSYNRLGQHGWASRGITLIDFGRGIDLKCFTPTVKFQADWTGTGSDCPEIKAMWSWKYNLDYYGVADLLHQSLFAKHLEYRSDPPLDKAPSTAPREHTLVHDSWKRGMAKELWLDVFEVLLHCGVREDGVRVTELERVKARMEAWLEEKGNDKELRAKLALAERYVALRK